MLNNMVYFSREEINFIDDYDINNKEIFFYLFYLCKKYPSGIYNFNKKINKTFKHRIKNEEFISIIGEKGSEKPFYIYISSYSITLKLSEFMINLFNSNNIEFMIDDNYEYCDEVIFYYRMHLNPKGYDYCKVCNKIIKKNTTQKYCKRCAKTVKNEQNKLRVRKYRINKV